MKNFLATLGTRAYEKNGAGTKVEQKVSREIKASLVSAFIESLGDSFEIMYDGKQPVIVLDNGLIIGFDFIVKGLDADLTAEPTK